MKNVFILLGPTGSGKTNVSIKFAEKMNGEIINIDSAQFYKKFKIGTGVPEKEERKGIKHHLFSFLEIEEEINSFAFKQKLEDVIKEILNKNKTPILVGGSHYYIHSLFFKEKLKEVNKEESFNIEKDIEDLESSILWKMLKKKDENRANQLNKNDKFRIINSLYKIEKYGYFPEILFSPSFKFSILEKKKPILYNEILKKRIDGFFNSGWLDEIFNLNLKEKEFLKKKKFIGYCEIISFLENEKNIGNKVDFDLLKETILKRTLYYSKKQCQFINKLKKELIFNQINWEEIE